MKILNLGEAYVLYEILKPVFPIVSPDTDVLDFFESLIENIENKDKQIIYDILELLSEEKDGKILESGINALDFLLESFVENQVAKLMDFFTGIIHV